MANTSQFTKYHGLMNALADFSLTLQNLHQDNLKLALMQTSSNAATLGLANYSELTNEVAQASGYVTGGFVLGNTSLNYDAGNLAIDLLSDDFALNLTGNLDYTFGVIYHETTGILLGYNALDFTGSIVNEINALTGQVVRVQFPNRKIMTIS